jgi:hypothetical protein
MQDNCEFRPLNLRVLEAVESRGVKPFIECLFEDNRNVSKVDIRVLQYGSGIEQ